MPSAPCASSFSVGWYIHRWGYFFGYRAEGQWATASWAQSRCSLTLGTARLLPWPDGAFIRFEVLRSETYKTSQNDPRDEPESADGERLPSESLGATSRFTCVCSSGPWPRCGWATQAWPSSCILVWASSSAWPGGLSFSSRGSRMRPARGAERLGFGQRGRAERGLHGTSGD